jgi:hypothetical protein
MNNRIRSVQAMEILDDILVTNPRDIARVIVGKTCNIELELGERARVGQ